MKWLLAAGVATFVALGVLAAGLGIANRDGGETAGLERPPGGSYRGSEPPGRIPMPQFALRESGGDLVRTADLRGKVTLLTFLDSQCTESCPVIASLLGRALEAMSPGERGDVRAVAISTDPAEDTAASVREFLRANRALGKILYVAAVSRCRGFAPSGRSSRSSPRSSPARTPCTRRPCGSTIATASGSQRSIPALT